VSGQSKHSRILELERRQRQMAKFIVACGAFPRTRNGNPYDRPEESELVADVLYGGLFNVRQARYFAQQAVIEGQVGADQAEFEGRFGEAARLRGRARTGARVLAALEGQPDDCETCEGRGSAIVRCEACRTTGANLRGILFLIKWAAAVTRKVSDSNHTWHPNKTPTASWTADIECMSLCPSMMRPTRIMKRGCHRLPEVGQATWLAGGDAPTLDGRISDRRWAPRRFLLEWPYPSEKREPGEWRRPQYLPKFETLAATYEPRWVRGERKHRIRRIRKVKIGWGSMAEIGPPQPTINLEELRNRIT